MDAIIGNLAGTELLVGAIDSICRGSILNMPVGLLVSRKYDDTYTILAVRLNSNGSHDTSRVSFAYRGDVSDVLHALTDKDYIVTVDFDCDGCDVSDSDIAIPEDSIDSLEIAVNEEILVKGGLMEKYVSAIVDHYLFLKSYVECKNSAVLDVEKMLDSIIFLYRAAECAMN